VGVGRGDVPSVERTGDSPADQSHLAVIGSSIALRAASRWLRIASESPHEGQSTVESK